MKVVLGNLVVGAAVIVGFGLAAAHAADSAPSSNIRMVSCPRGYCPCPQTPAAIAPSEAAPGGAAAVAPKTGALPAEAAVQAASPDVNALAGDYGATAGPQSIAPNMIGDLFSSGGFFQDPYWSSSSGVNVPIAGGDRRFKIAEDNNPIPVDRVFFDYNMFNRAVEGVDGRVRDLNRFTFGVEKTFFNGLTSVEIRVPFASGLNATQSSEVGASVVGTEFGNVPLAFKALTFRNEENAVGAGVAVVLPTARDGRLRDATGTDQILVKNEAVHVSPFIGWLWEPSGRRVFFESFAQVDFDCNGDTVYTRGITSGLLEQAGRYLDQNLLLLDFKVGYRWYENAEAHGITGIIPTFELHYTTTLQDGTSVGGVSSGASRYDILDATGGVHIMIGQLSTLTIAGGAPLRTGRDAQFTSEFVVQFNRRF